MSVSRDERARRIAAGMCVICGERPAAEGRKCCTECLERSRDIYRAKEEKKRKVRAMEREKAALDREIEHQREECGKCDFKRYVGDHRYTCLSAYGTCLRLDIRATEREKLREAMEKEKDEMQLLDVEAEDLEEDEIEE